MPVGKGDIITKGFLGAPRQASIDQAPEEGQALDPCEVVESGMPSGRVQLSSSPAVEPGVEGRYTLHKGIAASARGGHNVKAGLFELGPRRRGSLPAGLLQECLVDPQANGVLRKGKGQCLPSKAWEPASLQIAGKDVCQVIVGQSQFRIPKISVQGDHDTRRGVLGNHAGEGNCQVGQLTFHQLGLHRTVDAHVAALGDDVDDDIRVLGFEIADHFAQEHALGTVEGKGFPEDQPGHPRVRGFDRLRLGRRGRCRRWRDGLRFSRQWVATSQPGDK